MWKPDFRERALSLGDMARTREDFQANWRGARRYQFDEEYRRRMAALESDDQPSSATPPLPELIETAVMSEATQAALQPHSNRPVLLLAMVLAAASFAAVFFFDWSVVLR